MNDTITITFCLTRAQAETWRDYGMVVDYAESDCQVSDTLSDVQDAIDDAVDAALAVQPDVSLPVPDPDVRLAAGTNPLPYLQAGMRIQLARPPFGVLQPKVGTIVELYQDEQPSCLIQFDDVTVGPAVLPCWLVAKTYRLTEDFDPTFQETA